MFSKKQVQRTSDLSFLKIIKQLDILLTEQRHQRMDLSALRSTQLKIYNSLNLQKQVDEYFEDAAESKAEQVPEN